MIGKLVDLFQPRECAYDFRFCGYEALAMVLRYLRLHGADIDAATAKLEKPLAGNLAQVLHVAT